ncbi:MAG: hypothetical protein ABEL76_05655 [Bradymonadaceae bacterium]
MFGRSTRNASVLLARLLLWAPICAAAAVLYVHRHPIELDAERPDPATVRPRSTNPSDVLLVIDYDAIVASADRFSAQDWSAAWLSLFEQTIGPVAVATPDTLTADQIRRARSVVLTASVSDRVPSAVRDPLHRHVRSGGLLVQVRPEGALRERYAADGEAGRQRGHEITMAAGIPESTADRLRGMPVFAEYIGSTASREGARTLLAIDGAPVIYRLGVGEGHVLTVDFDLGEQLVSLQQGRPDERFRVRRPTATDANTPPSTEALIAGDELRGATTPYADLLERFVVWTAMAETEPVAGFWRFPAQSEGALVPIHADDRLGDRAGWMLAHEAHRGAASTLFTTADAGLTPAGAAVAAQRGGDVGLLWRRAGTPAQRTRRVGLFGIEPFVEPTSLSEQIDELAPRLRDERIRMVKTADEWWARRWTAPLRAVSAAGVPLDVSYEPDRPGYAFGTGLSFRPLGTSGLPLATRELPVVLPEGPRSLDAADALFEASRRTAHQAIVWRIDPERFADYPDVEQFEQWSSLIASSPERGHTVMTAREFAAFGRRRRGGELKSRYGPPDAVDAGRTPPETGRVLTVEGSSKLDRPALLIPRRPGDRSLLEVRVRSTRSDAQDTDEPPSTDLRIGGAPVRRVPLPSGAFEVTAYYR